MDDIISIPIREEQISYYMRMDEDELIEKYHGKRKNLNKRLGHNDMYSCYARQEIYEIEQALKKRNLL